MVVYFGDEVADALKELSLHDLKAGCTPSPAMNRHCSCQHRESVWVFRQLKIW